MTWKAILKEIIGKKMQLCPYIMELPQYNGVILCRVSKPSNSEELRALIKALDIITNDWTIVGFPMEFTARANDFEVCYRWRFGYDDNLYDTTKIKNIMITGVI